MCGIVGFIAVNEGRFSASKTDRDLNSLSNLIAHRGPDGNGTWVENNGRGGFAHRRLSVIDLSNSAIQPMHGPSGATIVFNGEIYNYKELRVLAETRGYKFRSHSDTEVILALFEIYGSEFVNKLRGMFALAIWDPKNNCLILAKDRFGIKPLYYTLNDGVLAFASEVKAVLPWLSSIRTDPEALAEYLTFQYTLGAATLFEGVRQLEPGHIAIFSSTGLQVHRYWDVEYQVDYAMDENFAVEKLTALLEDSVTFHLESDVEIGAYVSGGVDSSLIASMAAERTPAKLKTFHGKFSEYPGYDESDFALSAANQIGSELNIYDIESSDFVSNIEKIIYHLDYPVAGPGSFPQFVVSENAAKQVKVVLGGQGGDEIFGGYARYLLAYFEQTIKAAIEGNYKSGNFVVTIESIVPNLVSLKEYKPLMQTFWREGLFGELDERFYRLINRSTDMADEVKWGELDTVGVWNRFSTIFNNPNNVQNEAYFDKMTHFEFKTLLPALLQVEDRMSMAHGLESRVPFLDHPLVEFMATVPANIKFKNGQLKYLLRQAFQDSVPSNIFNRRDKMGFPVPLQEWFKGPLNSFMGDLFASAETREREFLDFHVARERMADGGRFSRKTWALLSLEIWQQQFHDRESFWLKQIGG